VSQGIKKVAAKRGRLLSSGLFGIWSKKDLLSEAIKILSDKGF